MKYFTPELWNSWNQLDWTPPPAESDPFRLYRAELESLRGRMEPDTYAFFAEADVHDGELLDFTVVDGSRPAPLGEPARQWTSVPLPVVVVLRVLDAWDRHVWTLRYTQVRRVDVRYASDAELGDCGFQDWGYHELSDAGNGFFRHEILFRSFSTLLVEFKHVAIARAQARDSQE